MKYFVTLIYCLLTSISFCQTGAFGFFNLSYGAINDAFIDDTSDGFLNQNIQLNESGFGLGGNGIYLFSKNYVGLGGSIVFLNSESDEIKMNTGTAYGVFGYKFHFYDDIILNIGGRIGWIGNTLMVEKQNDNIFLFGDYFITEDVTFTSGSLIMGVEVNIIKTVPTFVPGLALGLSTYVMTPLSNFYWTDENFKGVNGLEENAYFHYGFTLKIGLGKLF